MIETVDQRGLKKRFLRKHKISVDRFYKRLSGEFRTSDIANKITERLQKNRNTMFTFLDFDDVPWNNNNAEHAIKAFATLRRVIGGTTTEKGLRDYLVLLSVCETCKYKNVTSSIFYVPVRRMSMILCSADEGGMHRVGDNPPCFRPGLRGVSREAPATRESGRSAKLAFVLIGHTHERQRRDTISPLVPVAPNPPRRTTK